MLRVIPYCYIYQFTKCQSLMNPQALIIFRACIMKTCMLWLGFFFSFKLILFIKGLYYCLWRIFLCGISVAFMPSDTSNHTLKNKKPRGNWHVFSLLLHLGPGTLYHFLCIIRTTARCCYFVWHMPFTWCHRIVVCTCSELTMTQSLMPRWLVALLVTSITLATQTVLRKLCILKRKVKSSSSPAAASARARRWVQ